MISVVSRYVIGFTCHNESMLIGLFRQRQFADERKWLFVSADVRGTGTRDEPPGTSAWEANINEQISKCKFTFKGAGERNALHCASKNKTIKTVSNFLAQIFTERIWCLRLHGKSNLSWPLTKIPLFFQCFPMR